MSGHNGTVKVNPEDHLDIARRKARKFHARAPGVPEEDFFQAAALRVCQCAGRARDGNGTFRAYAGKSAEGACKDLLRSTDGMSRPGRVTLKRIQDAENALAQKFGSWPTRAEVAGQLGLAEREVDRVICEHSAATVFYLDQEIENESRDERPYPITLMDCIPGLEDVDVLARRSARAELLGLLTTANLNDRDLAVLALVGFGDFEQKELEDVFAVSSGRISQIYLGALAALRRAAARRVHGCQVRQAPVTEE